MQILGSFLLFSRMSVEIGGLAAKPIYDELSNA
jgi:hypothetical protein